MQPNSYEDLVRAKQRIQKEKEAALHRMSDADWKRAKANFIQSSPDDRMPPKIQAIRHYRDLGLGF